MILGTIIACIFWGLLIAVALTALVYVLSSLLRPANAQNPVTWIVHCVLLILLWVQATLLVGGFKAKGYVNDLCATANELIQLGGDSAQGIMNTADDFGQLCDQLAADYPILRPLLSRIDASAVFAYVAQGHTVVDYISENVRSQVGAYLWRRVWWALGFVVVAVAAVVLTSRAHRNSASYNNDDTASDYLMDNYLDNSII